MSAAENPTLMVENLPSTTEPEDTKLTIDEIMENWARSRQNAPDDTSSVPSSAYETSLGKCVDVKMEPGGEWTVEGCNDYSSPQDCVEAPGDGSASYPEYVSN
jgi:hypothetical protein